MNPTGSRAFIPIATGRGPPLSIAITYAVAVLVGVTLTGCGGGTTVTTPAPVIVMTEVESGGSGGARSATLPGGSDWTGAAGGASEEGGEGREG